jgi:hypothetical protein
MPASLAPLHKSLIGRLPHVDAGLARRAAEPPVHAVGDVCPSFGNGYHSNSWGGQSSSGRLSPTFVRDCLIW